MITEIINERDALNAKNKAQAERIEKLCVENGILWEKNRVQTERIEELEMLLREAGSVEEDTKL